MLYFLRASRQQDSARISPTKRKGYCRPSLCLDLLLLLLRRVGFAFPSKPVVMTDELPFRGLPKEASLDVRADPPVEVPCRAGAVAVDERDEDAVPAGVQGQEERREGAPPQHDMLRLGENAYRVLFCKTKNLTVGRAGERRGQIACFRKIN